MRPFTILMACAAVAASTTGAAAQGDAFGAGTTPAEMPPNGFNGRQYVDSLGCVFVRAGQGDVVAWMPRVTRSNEPLCGYTPTQLGAGIAPERQVSIASNAPATGTTLASVRDVVSVSAPRSGDRGMVSQGAVPAATIAPDVVTRPATRAACRASALRVGHGTRCDEAAQDGVGGHLAAIVIPRQSRNSTHGSEGGSVAPVTIVVASDATYKFPPNVQQAGTVIVGEAEAVTRLGRDTQRIAVPKGYKEAWTDGRLNVFRGVGTALGETQMRRTWSERVPQRLIDSDG